MAKISDPFGGRSVDEWIGSSPDAAVPARVKSRVFARAGGVCHISGRKIGAGEAWDLEHVVPLSAGGEHRESNLAPALKDAHREKTSAEAGQRSKADRIRMKHDGSWPKSRAKIQGRGFQSTR